MTTCLHCEVNPAIKGETICESCAALPRCSACQVIFGDTALNRRSKLREDRCDSCESLEDNIELSCQVCGKRLALYFSPHTNTLHYIVRGNFCYACNSICAIQSRAIKEKIVPEDFVGYLAILVKHVGVNDPSFAEAMELNPHDITKPILPVIKA